MNIGHPILSSILYNNHQAGHIGICGNNKADMAAKSAHQFKVANSEFLVLKVLKCFNKYYIDFYWQIFWDIYAEHKNVLYSKQS